VIGRAVRWCCGAGNPHPTLGRERRMRSYIPNVSSIIAKFKREFEYSDDYLRDTLERVFLFVLEMDTVSIVWS